MTLNTQPPGAKTVEELAKSLGHANTDALRKRWDRFGFSQPFSRDTVLTQAQVDTIMDTYKQRSVIVRGTPDNSWSQILNSVPVKENPKPGIPSVPSSEIPPSVKPGIPSVPSLEIPSPVKPGIPSVPSSVGNSGTGTVWPIVLISAAVLVLVISSVISVGDVLRHTNPIGFWAYFIALVICSAPLLIMSAGRQLPKALAYVTMTITLVLEICCNAVAINRHTSIEYVRSVHHATAMDDITLSWSLGIGLPVLALMFEIVLLNIISKK